MIIVKIKGGLGNQMFQYTMARRLAIISKSELKLDIGESPELFQKNTARSYGLDHFNITAPLASKEETRKLKYPYGIISKFSRRFQFWVLKKYNIEFDPAYLKPIDKNKSFYLDGFWQSYKYFADIHDVIRKEFTIKEPLSPDAEKINQMIYPPPYAVSLNVRRGDYASDPETNKNHGQVCTIEYYENALKIMKEKVGEFNIFLFSDDIPWVKENLKFPYPTTYVSNPRAIPDYQEIALISNCNGHIIANSSFGWWGAWLNNKPGKIVIAPKTWTKNPNSHKDIIPPGWIRI